MQYHISFEDALDHGTTVDTFETYEEAKVSFDKWVKVGPEDYDISVEIIQVNEDEDGDEEWETLDYHEWFTKESWEEAHPWNDKEGVWENVD